MRFVRVAAAIASTFAIIVPTLSSAATTGVDIPGRYFQPQTVKVYVGDTVVWTNSSNERHSVKAASDSHEQFGSSSNCPGRGLFGKNDCIRPGGSYAHTFNERGTFTYYCRLHGSDAPFPNCGMCGRVRVVRRSSGTIAPMPPGSLSPSPTGTATSPSPTASASGSPTAPTSPVAGGDDGSGGRSSSVVAIAAVAVVVLGGSGFLVYRSYIRR